MRRLWSAAELGERWKLGVEGLALVSGLPDAGKPGLAAERILSPAYHIISTAEARIGRPLTPVSFAGVARRSVIRRH